MNGSSAPRRVTARACGFVALLLLSLAGVGATTGAAEPTRPNLVIFLSDDHGLLDSTVYGALDVRTPNMRRLADAGLTFSHAFVASPSCAPSRAALLTGLMPARNGAEANHSKPRAEHHQRPREELYDLKADPHEQHNLAGDPAQAERLAQMRGEVEQWMKEQGDAQRVFGEPRLLSPAGP